MTDAPAARPEQRPPVATQHAETKRKGSGLMAWIGGGRACGVEGRAPDAVAASMRHVRPKPAGAQRHKQRMSMQACRE
eukprot:157394-Chlamydomonas_euryale.AAC.1